MHTVLLTRIISADDDELSRLTQVQKQIAYLHDGIKLWFHPLLQTDEGEAHVFVISHRNLACSNMIVYQEKLLLYCRYEK